MLNVLEVAELNPAALALNVYPVPDLSIERPEKVAIPEEAAVAEPPVKVPEPAFVPNPSVMFPE